MPTVIIVNYFWTPWTRTYTSACIGHKIITSHIYEEEVELKLNSGAEYLIRYPSVIWPTKFNVREYNYFSFSVFFFYVGLDAEKLQSFTGTVKKKMCLDFFSHFWLRYINFERRSVYFLTQTCLCILIQCTVYKQIRISQQILIIIIFCKRRQKTYIYIIRLLLYYIK